MTIDASTHATPPLLPVDTREQGWKPLAHFGLDALLAIVLSQGLSLVGLVGWAAARTVQLSIEHQGAVDPSKVASQLGMPGGMAMLWIVLLAYPPTAVLLYFWRRRASAAERIASAIAARRARTLLWAVIVGLATALGGALVAWLAQRSGLRMEASNIAMIKEIASRPLLLFVFAVLLAPAYEELLFRRVLFGRLWAAGRPWLGLLLSSIAFALTHEPPGLSGNRGGALALLLLIYTLMGAAFAWLYRRTGTLWAPVVAHATSNLIACGLLLMGLDA
ncbi:lysostaphin resistance A-like protein [Lysobacter rhizosphaerae]